MSARARCSEASALLRRALGARLSCQTQPPSAWTAARGQSPFEDLHAHRRRRHDRPWRRHARREGFGARQRRTAPSMSSTARSASCSPAISPDRIREVLTQAQHDLFDLGGELCIPGMAMVSDADITRLEGHARRVQRDVAAAEGFHPARRRHRRGASAISRARSAAAPNAKSITLIATSKLCAAKRSAISTGFRICCSCSRACSRARADMAKCCGSTSGASADPK